MNPTANAPDYPTQETPRLPEIFDTAINDVATDLDDFLREEDRPATVFDAKVAAYRKVSLSHILSFRGTQTFDLKLIPPGTTIPVWPDYLYIPAADDPLTYWVSFPPASHRYALAWTSPAGSPNTASIQNGNLFSWAQLNPTTNTGESSESGVGVFYTPPMSFGLIDLQPQVDCSGSLRWLLETQQLVAGQVDIKAQLIVAAWQVIPGGFNLISWRLFDVASIRRDQTFGRELTNFTRSFAGPNLSVQFFVQAGRTYLLGVVARMSVTSSLTANAVGGTLFPLSNNELRAWGSMNCVVPEIDVFTRPLFLP